MAETLIQTNLFSPLDHRLVSCKKDKSKPAFVGFPRSSSLKSDFNGTDLAVKDGRERSSNRSPHAVSVQMSLCVGKAMKWWEKGLQPNMKEITSARDLVDSLKNAGDKLVVVDFFTLGCGGCKALHPKICQFAEMNPEVQFLQVNYEEHKSMCYSLNVHVLPFFRFYRGAHGRLCSFSCTNATIKKFKDALAKHTTDRCSLRPAKGLEESELMALAANRDLPFNYTREPEPEPEPVHAQDAVPEPAPPSPRFAISSVPRDSQEKALAGARR